MQNRPPHLLIIRFSSFGDIVQALAAPAGFFERFPTARIDWLVRDDFRGLLDRHPRLTEVISFHRRQSVIELISLAWRISNPAHGYTHLYDAHQNLRSALVRWVFRFRNLIRPASRVQILVRPKNRWRRFLYFKFGLQTLPEPFRGAESFLWPLKKWAVPQDVPKAPLFFTDARIPAEVLQDLQKLRAVAASARISSGASILPFAMSAGVRPEASPLVALVPSAAWEMKRWPVEHFRELITMWPEASFVLLGGPDDHFLEEIQQVAPDRVLNTAGRLSLAQSSELLKAMDLVIANDTGLLHVADQLGRPTLALIGPSAFGYPSQLTSSTSEIKLPCKPCSKDGRGGCVNSLYKRCLVELTPQHVFADAKLRLKGGK